VVVGVDQPKSALISRPLLVFHANSELIARLRTVPEIPDIGHLGIALSPGGLHHQIEFRKMAIDVVDDAGPVGSLAYRIRIGEG
jgi:hypothetical protein